MENMNNFLKTKTAALFAAAALLGGLSGCWDENEWESIPNGAFLQVAETSLNFDSPATTYLMATDWRTGVRQRRTSWAT